MHAKTENEQFTREREIMQQNDFLFRGFFTKWVEKTNFPFAGLQPNHKNWDVFPPH